VPRFVPAIGALQLLDVVKVDAVQDQPRRVQPAEPLLHHLVDVSVVGNRRFPAHPADQTDRLHMLRRYCPPTSNNALVICPSEQRRRASISTSQTLPSAITVSLSRCTAAGASLAWRSWKSASRASWLRFSSSVERASSMCPETGSPCGLRKVFTPMIGYSPVCFSDS